MKTAFGDDEFNILYSKHSWLALVYNRHCLEQKISHFVIKYASQCQILHQKSKTNVIKSKYIVRKRDYCRPKYNNTTV